MKNKEKNQAHEELCGHGKPGEVMEFELLISRPGEVMEIF